MNDRFNGYKLADLAEPVSAGEQFTIHATPEGTHFAVDLVSFASVEDAFAHAVSEGDTPEGVTFETCPIVGATGLPSRTWPSDETEQGVILYGINQYLEAVATLEDDAAEAGYDVDDWAEIVTAWGDFIGEAYARDADASTVADALVGHYESRRDFAKTLFSEQGAAPYALEAGRELDKSGSMREGGAEAAVQRLLDMISDDAIVAEVSTWNYHYHEETGYAFRVT